MKKILTFLVLMTYSISWSQSNLESSYSEDLKNLQNERVNLKSLNKKRDLLLKISEEASTAYQEARSEYRNLDERKKNSYDALTKYLTKELSSSKASFKDQLRITKDGPRRKYRSFLRCVNNSLKYGIGPSENMLGKCNMDKADFNPEFKKHFLEAKKVLTKNKNGLRNLMNNLYLKSKSAYDDLNIQNQKIESTTKTINEKEKKLKDLKKKIVKDKLLSKHKNLLECNPSTPSIDLENEYIMKGSQVKGSFYKVPRDHQDSLGTCYANTARNLLLGVSNQKIDASFLDIALQYKSAVSSKVTSIEGGNECGAIEKLKETGYCPKNLSPIETGDITQIQGENLVNSNLSLYSQANTLDLIRNYLNNKSLLENNKDKVSKSFIRNTKQMLNELIKDENIKLPFPTLDDFPIDPYQARSLYLWSYEDSIKKRIQAGEKGLEIIPEDEFMNEFERAKHEFTVGYVSSDKYNSAEAKKEFFEKSFQKFIKKYNLQERLTDNFYTHKLNNYYKKEKPEKTKNEMEATLNFYKKFVDKNLSQSSMIELYTTQCVSNPKSLKNFSTSLNDIIQLFKSSNIDVNSLYDEDGNDISNKEFLQLATVPKCLSPQNRISLPKSITCHNKREGEYDPNNMIKEKKEDILLSLAQGLPVANSFKQLNGNHVNTIVGSRYNPETKTCQFKIRESQNADFYWIDHDRLAQKAYALAFISKEEEE